jgi:hypothetical protein
MDDLLKEKPKGKLDIKILAVGVLIAVLIFVGIGAAVYYMPTPEQKKEVTLKGAHLPGSDVFEQYTQEIVITTDTKRLQESRTALGEIIMNIGGRIRNKGDRTINGLEVSVGMIDSKNELIKEKKYVIIPTKQSELAPGETIDLTATVAGFKSDDDRANARWKVTAIRLKDE